MSKMQRQREEHEKTGGVENVPKIRKGLRCGKVTELVTLYTFNILKNKNGKTVKKNDMHRIVVYKLKEQRDLHKEHLCQDFFKIKTTQIS